MSSRSIVIGDPKVSPKYGGKRVNNGRPLYQVQGDAILASLDDGLPATAIKTEKVDLTKAEPIECPCCKQPVRAPSLEIIINNYAITPLEARILGAIWKGRGMPVMTERVFDAMYVDDPDGGPSPPRMYQAFKVALCHMRAKLQGSGISIENVGYRRGYRLVLGDA